MASRRRAREVVIQVLFQRDLNPGSDYDVEDQFVRDRLKRDSRFVDFAIALLRGIQSHQEGIDEALSKTAQNWKLGRMAATDRAILRLATFEILFFEQTPGPVAINEAIELAKRYGTNNSSQFVNGILDRLHKNSESFAKTSEQVAEAEPQELPEKSEQLESESE